LAPPEPAAPEASGAAVNAEEPAAAAAPPPEPAEVEALDLAAVGAVPVLKRLGPVFAVAVAAFLFLRWRSR
jgi:hypothetical protein